MSRHCTRPAKHRCTGRGTTEHTLAAHAERTGQMWKEPHAKKTAHTARHPFTCTATHGNSLTRSLVPSLLNHVSSLSLRHAFRLALMPPPLLVVFKVLVIVVFISGHGMPQPSISDFIVKFSSPVTRKRTCIQLFSGLPVLVFGAVLLPSCLSSSIRRGLPSRCRGQVTGSCRGFGVFAAAADKAGNGGVELWIRQDIMGDPRSSHVLVAEPRFLLVQGHTGADSTRDQAEIQAWWRRAVVPRHSFGA